MRQFLVSVDNSRHRVMMEAYCYTKATSEYPLPQSPESCTPPIGLNPNEASLEERLRGSLHVPGGDYGERGGGGDEEEAGDEFSRWGTISLAVPHFSTIS